MQIYYPLLTFVVGELFQIPNPYENNAEGPLLVTHAEGVNLILYSDNVEADLPIWGTQALQIGLTEFADIPFICLTFPDCELTLLYTLNIYKMLGDERGPWLNSIGSELGVLLVDNQTGRLACIRMMNTALIARLRHICRNQRVQYADALAVELQVEQLLNPPKDANLNENFITASRVMHRAELTNQVVISYPQKTVEP